jgi:hypothetical protein
MRRFRMETTLDWLLDSDPSIQAQVKKDLLAVSPEESRRAEAAIPEGGWARELMRRRKGDGHWGDGAYNPKWTCTHYVLYELVQLGMPRDDRACGESTALLFGYPRGREGGVNYARTVDCSDVCVNGMILTIGVHFRAAERALLELVDFLLGARMADGGWNCEYLRGAVHGSLHTTIAVLEGLEAFEAEAGQHRRAEIRDAIAAAIEFILKHRLYKSDRTGEAIKDEFFKFCFPVRWKYDILRCLDLFRKFGVAEDARMGEALDIVDAAKNANGRWKARSQPGKTYFAMERNGEEGRWNTLRALRVLEHYGRRHHGIP